MASSFEQRPRAATGPRARSIDGAVSGRRQVTSRGESYLRLNVSGSLRMRAGSVAAVVGAEVLTQPSKH